MTTWNERNLVVITEFRSNGGKLGGNFEGAPVLLISTKGAKTGLSRTNPLMYLPDGDRLIVFASKAGAPTSPDWFHNLVANPVVTLEVGTETFEADAEMVSSQERDRLYARQAELYPRFGEYETKTSRRIPVVALTRKRSP